jgi:hypothetical protein
MNAKPNSYLGVAVLQPETISGSVLMRANNAGTPKHTPLEQRAIVGDNSNSENSLATHIAHSTKREPQNSMPIRCLRFSLVSIVH